MRILSVVGARPQFVKIAPVSRALARRKAATGGRIEDVIVHTGQHYDPAMSEIFFDELEIPRAAFHLGVGSAPHGAQTGRMLERIEALLIEQQPAAVVVYGDTNSTLAGALAAVKLHLPLLHVEAGLRSFNRRMPEEINRIATDHVSDWLLAPTPTAMRNLSAERLADRAVLTGDVMLDAVRYYEGLAARRSRIVEDLGLTPGAYGVVTVHRAENTEAASLLALLEILNEMADTEPLVFPVHPRTRHRLETTLERWHPAAGLRLVDPLGYLDMLRLVSSASLVLTDSGGLQKEAFFLRVPCVTLRTETEWPETVEAGGNIVTGVDRDRVLSAVASIRERRRTGALPLATAVEASFGRADAAERIVEEIVAVASGERELVGRPAA